MNRLRVIVTAEVDKTVLEPLSNIFEFTYCGYCQDYSMISHGELKALCSNADILISEFDTIDEDILSVATIKLIVCCRAGVSTVVDLEAAKRHNVIVCNNVGRNKDATADFTLGLIYDLMRNITLTDRLIHGEKLGELCRPMPKEYGDALWGLDKHSPYVRYRAPSAHEVVVGVIGYGQIGKVLCHKLELLGFNYLVHTNHPVEGDSRFVSMDELLSRSDIITLHISGNKNKSPVITLDEFKKMKPTACFINTSRGYLVDERSLYEALDKKIIASAAVDVLAQEPIRGNNKLLKLDNLIITPHIAGSSKDTIICGTKMVVDALIGFAKGDVPNRVV